MANWEYEIKATGYKHDMAPWLNEKANTLIDSLGRVVETLMKDEALSAELKDRIQFQFGTALDQATKIIAFSSGSEWGVTDADDILTQGRKGVEVVKKLYELHRRDATAAIQVKMGSFQDILGGDDEDEGPVQ